MCVGVYGISVRMSYGFMYVCTHVRRYAFMEIVQPTVHYVVLNGSFMVLGFYD